ncbi:GH3 auxin-responsive promoter family protein, partial [Candidatus Pacearchaeota archaeon]|nr:GH3 auxin-responsive promoter family protein [Candidatus Pacearchaeota archaeon]
MGHNFGVSKDELFEKGYKDKVWQKYCGYLDLSLAEFMKIQERLLDNHIELIHDSALAKMLMPQKPKNYDEFRGLVPLTRYENYAAYLSSRREDVLAIKPALWCHTSGRGGSFKWVPYSQEGIERLALSTSAMIILACANKKGEVNIRSGFRFLQNLAPPPYLSGILIQILAEYLGARVIPPLDKYQDADFQTRIQAGFQTALRTGVDVLGSLTSVLVRMGEHFAERQGQGKFQSHMLYPQTMYRLLTDMLRSKREGRALLPKDLWSLKGIVCFGMDTSIYRDQIVHYWGKEPLEAYAATETGVIATQVWNKESMTFTPFSCFLEFVPENEWLKSRENPDHQPTTVLLDKVKPGERYEVVVTSFYGMPFLRYRIGDLIKIVALEHEQTGIKIPQMVFDSRADDLIDIAGFSRLDEKTIWQALVNTGIKYEDWCARKEYEEDKPVLCLYIELKEERELVDVEQAVHTQLTNANPDYGNLEKMLGIRPLRITLLTRGSFG